MLAFSLTLVAVGCAPKVTAVRGNELRAEVTLHRSKQRTFTLYSTDLEEEVSRGTADADGVVVFELPDVEAMDDRDPYTGRLVVVDRKRWRPVAPVGADRSYISHLPHPLGSR